MDILYCLAGISLLWSTVVQSSPDNICQSNDIDLVFVIDCLFPPLQWSMIQNILGLFNTAASQNETKNLNVDLFDLFSQKKFIIHDSNIDNVSDICQMITDAETTFNVFEVEEMFKGEDYNSSNLIIVALYRKNNRHKPDHYLRNLKYKKLLEICITHGKFKCKSNNSPNYVKVDSEDDLKYNNEVSLKLCSQCLTNWLPLHDANNKNLISSCFHFDKQINNISWQEAANNCIQKRSHLITFETIMSFRIFSSSLEKIENFSKIDFGSEDVIYFYIGLNTLNVRYNKHLVWINNNPVDVFLYSEIKNWRNSFNGEKTCFALKYNVLQRDVKKIINVKCRSNMSRYSSCEQNLFQSFKTIKSNSQMLTYAVPNNNFINNKSKITSISNSKTLSRIDFPKFYCTEKTDYRSYNYVCDGVLDCANKMDEKQCNYDIQTLEECIKNGRFLCREPNVYGLTCIARRQVCDMVKDCPDGSDESNCDDCILTQCSPNVCIPDYWTLNCSIINQMNEPDDKLSLNNAIMTEFKLQNLNELKTMCNLTYNDSNETYNKLWAPKCIYIKDRHGAHIGCSDFSHLLNCSMFKCPEGFSKCWESYCIPDSFIHDGVKDCPHGEDEEENIVTNGLHFACYSSSKKINPIYICDGKPQCPRGDDELNCQVLHCPSGFICLDGTVTVNDTSTMLNMSSILPDTTFLNISGIDVSRTENFINIQHLKKLLVFIVSMCRIDDNVRIIADKNVIYHLDVSYNNLSKFSYSDFFSNFLNIIYLNVSHNTDLHFIPRFYFRRFEKLTYLDLSFSKIIEINLKFNKEIKFLYLLETNLENINLSKFSRYRMIDLRNTLVSDTMKEKFFNNITVKGKVLADYKLCCSYFRGEKLSAHQCEAEEQPLSTCEDLIGHSLKRVFLWVVAICAILGNMIALGYRILFERETLHLTYVLFVTCLGVSDLLMGFYLVIIASVDVVYRNIYIIYESSWKRSTLCQIAGTLATLSSETSTFFILLITLERFLTIRFPFGEHKISNLTKYVLISLAWCLGFLLSVVPTMYEKKSLYSTNGMCLGFPLRKSSGIGWAYSVTVFLFFNSFLFIVIAIGQFLIFMTISQHSSKIKTESQTSARRADNITVALKLSVVVLSNFICWFPVCVLGIRTVVSDYEVTSETYSWIISLVLPINSALNPILYTLPRMYRLWKEFKQRKSSVA